MDVLIFLSVKHFDNFDVFKSHYLHSRIDIDIVHFQFKHMVSDTLFRYHLLLNYIVVLVTLTQ
jgi:hypothetical protein